MSPRKVYRWQKFQKFASNKIRFSLNGKNPRNFFINPLLFAPLVYLLLSNTRLLFCIYAPLVYLLLSNTRQNGWTDRVQSLCGTSHDPRVGLWIIKISKINLQQNSMFIKFWKSTIFFIKVFCLFLYYNLYQRENIQLKKKIGAKRPESLDTHILVVMKRLYEGQCTKKSSENHWIKYRLIYNVSKVTTTTIRQNILLITFIKI